MEQQEVSALTDRQLTVHVANRIRDYWKGLGFEVKIEVRNDGSIRSDMIAGKPTRRLGHLSPRS